MNRDDIIRMAREARAEAQQVYDAIRDGTMDFDDFLNDYLDNLRNIEFDEGYKAGAEDEREACAKVCEELGYYAKHGGWGCADAIRERGQG